MGRRMLRTFEKKALDFRAPWFGGKNRLDTPSGKRNLVGPKPCESTKNPFKRGGCVIFSDSEKGGGGCALCPGNHEHNQFF